MYLFYNISEVSRQTTFRHWVFSRKKTYMAPEKGASALFSKKGGGESSNSFTYYYVQSFTIGKHNIVRPSVRSMKVCVYDFSGLLLPTREKMGPSWAKVLLSSFPSFLDHLTHDGSKVERSTSSSEWNNSWRGHRSGFGHLTSNCNVLYIKNRGDSSKDPR